MSEQVQMTKKQKQAVDRALKKEAAKHHEEMVKEENRLAKITKIPPNDSFIILKNINKIYDNHVQAVFNFNLDIKQREFIVFVGPSGCGKSTTLRMIAGLEDITYGDFFIDGKYCNLTPPKDRQLAMVFQNYALYPHMSVYDNMAFGIKIRKAKAYRYEKSPEMDEEKQKLQELEKKLTKVKPDNKEEIEYYQKQIAESKEKLEEIINNQKPIMFIDKNMIKQIKKEIKKDMSSYTELKKKIVSLPELSEEREETEKIIVELEKAINSLNEQLDYYEHNEVHAYIYRHLTKEEIDERVQNAARILNLLPYLDRKPSAMSGGQRQRVALGRAIVRNAKVLLMDEPLSNLDAKLRVQMRSEIAQLHERMGSTTIYVTHDQTEAMTMADRIVVMKDGHVQQVDTPSQIYDHPSNTFVAGFIGSPAMNIFPAELKGNEVSLTDSYSFKLSKEQMKLLETYIEETTKSVKKKLENLHKLRDKQSESAKISEGNVQIFKQREEQYNHSLEQFDIYRKGGSIKVEFGIRAEDLHQLDIPTQTTGIDLTPAMNVKVVVAEFLGHEYFIHFNLGENSIVAKVPVTGKLIKGGDTVKIAMGADKIHLFDFDSKNTIF